MKLLLLALLGIFVCDYVLPTHSSSQTSHTISIKTTASTAGLGTITFPTSGSLKAQPWFIRGVLLLHSFEYDDAKEAFRQSQALDPDFAMAYWGEAMTENHPLWLEQDLEEARAILKRLGSTLEDRMAKAPAQRERGYLHAVEVLYGEGDKQSRDFAYAKAMQKLAKDFPNDHEAAAFYALAILGTRQGERDVRTYMKAAAIAEEVFRKNPKHPGAVHYLIHAYDDPIHAPLGLRVARIYGALAPAASHAQHMPSHIFMALGMWDDVVKANEASWAASRARIEQKGMENGTPPYHTLHWLEYAFLQQGRVEDAKKLVKLIEQEARQSQSRTARRYLASMRATYIIEIQEWDVSHFKEDRSGVSVTAAASELFAIGMSAVKTKKLGMAREVLAQLNKNVTSSNESLSPSDRSTVTIMAKQLEGLLRIAEGNIDKGLTRLRESTSLANERPYTYGPPNPVKPPHELLGEILLQLNRPKDAKHEFELALAQAPNRLLSTSGLERANTNMTK